MDGKHSSQNNFQYSTRFGRKIAQKNKLLINLNLHSLIPLVNKSQNFIEQSISKLSYLAQ